MWEILKVDFQLRPFELGAPQAHFRVAGRFHPAHFDDRLRLLPAVESFGADALPGTTQLPRGGLCAAAFGGQAAPHWFWVP